MMSDVSACLICVCAGACHNGVVRRVFLQELKTKQESEQQRLSSSLKSHSQRKRLCKVLPQTSQSRRGRSRTRYIVNQPRSEPRRQKSKNHRYNCTYVYRSCGCSKVLNWHYQHLVSVRKYARKYINTSRAHICCTIWQLDTLFSIIYLHIVRIAMKMYGFWIFFALLQTTITTGFSNLNALVLL